MGQVIYSRPVISGQAEGKLLVSYEPLSFWGGFDQHSGEIIDRRHPLSGQNAAGRILALPFTRGSSTTTTVLVEAVRAKVAPVAIISTGVDKVLALASILANELYGHLLPIVALQPHEFKQLSSGMRAVIRQDGTITLTTSKT